MKVLLLQLDGRLPNLALMRTAAHHRERGDTVEFRRTGSLASVEPHLGDDYDRICASTIFTRTRPVAERLQQIRPDAIIGGTGWALTTRLEDHGITTEACDYSLYPGWPHSIGFTQRGCRLKCGFCVVPKTEGKVREASAIGEIWRGDPWPRNLCLLDNDFFGSPDWRQKIEEIQRGDFKVSFCQGINARCLTDEAAEAIASVPYYDDEFTRRCIYTAWDSLPDEKRLFAGLNALVRYGVKPDHITVYMLCGYQPGETHEDRELRRRKLREFGARPYPMTYVRTPELVAYQRWVVRRIDLMVPWQDYAAAHYRPERIRPAAVFPLLEACS